MSLQPIAPHPKLVRYYAREAQRSGMVRNLFDEGAEHYEWICRMMSLGTGESYRRRALSAAGLEPGMRLLDVATGTGLVLRSASRLVGGSGLAIGLDPSSGMLRECRSRSDAPLLQGRGENLPLADASFDMVTMGYALRHVPDLRALFGEYHRVLKPGGRVLVLELTQPRSAPARWLNRLYLRTLVPGIARMGTGAPAARKMMHYFWDTIENCVPPEVIVSALRESGFADALRKVSGGVLSEYVGTKTQ